MAAAIAFVYAPVAGFDFVSWDDPWYVSKNPHVTGGLGWGAAWWALTTGSDFYWHPLTWLSHQLDVTLFGMHAGWHHVTSVVLHTATTVLLFWLLKGAGFWRAALAAALFGLHPLRVESVAWVAERKDVLSGLFWMLTIAAYFATFGRRLAWRGRRPACPSTGHPGSRARSLGWKRYLLVAAVFAAGLMAKPMIVTLPLVLLLLDVWPLGRWDPASGQRPAAGGLLFEKLPLFGLSLAAGVVTVIVQARAGAVGGLTDLPLSYRLSNATVSYLAYVGKMVWPADLAAFYPYPASLPPWWLVGLSFAAIAAAAWAAVASARTRPYVTVGILWYLVTLLPVSGLIQAGDQLMADRFTYLPSIGLIVAVVWGGADLVDAACRRLPKDREWVARALVTAVIAVVLVACATVSRAQVAHWRNSETLWTRALAVTTGNHRAHAGLAEWQAERGLMDKAIANYREAVRLAPAGGDYRHALGMALARQGQTEEASRELAEAVRLNPGRANARVSLAAIMVREGRVGEAVSQYREALRIEPRMPQALSGLGFALVQEGRFQEAAQSCLQAAQLDRQSFDGRMCAGLALARLGDASRAAAEFHEATVLDPSSEAAFVNLGIALTRVGPARKADAIAAFEKALRINPANEAVRGAVEELRR